MKNMKTLAIIGFGRFGQLMAEVLRLHFDVCAYNPRDKSKIARSLCVRYESSLEKAAASKDIVVLSMPISKLEGVLGDIAPHLKPGALVLDVCSVKQKPCELMRDVLPQTVDVVGTHPLFGPDSTKVDGQAVHNILGRKVAVCPVRMQKHSLRNICKFLEKIGLVTYVVTPRDHDRQMAVAQGLTHYIALALRGMDVGKQDLTTPKFDALLGIVEKLSNDTDVLLEDIQVLNPYAVEQRQRFRKALDDVEKEIGGN
ncbi:MAG: prephenate dehydrogenase [archaeon]|nr:prephenate dehydrogenase [archaeon]